jgi:hypothetical protein
MGERRVERGRPLEGVGYETHVMAVLCVLAQLLACPLLKIKFLDCAALCFDTLLCLLRLLFRRLGHLPGEEYRYRTVLLAADRDRDPVTLSLTVKLQWVAIIRGGYGTGTRFSLLKKIKSASTR